MDDVRTETRTPAKRPPLTEDQQQLVVKFAWKAERMASARVNPFVDPDDRLQHAYLGLMDAARSFDPSLGFKFVTHAHDRIWGAIRDGERGGGFFGDVRGQMKAAKKSGREMPRVKLVGGTKAGVASDPDGDEIDLGSLFVAPREPNTLDDRDEIDAAMEVLSPRERLIVEARFLKERTQKQAAELVGLSESSISKMIPGLLERLRSHSAFSTNKPIRKGIFMSAAIQCERDTSNGSTRLTVDDIGGPSDDPPPTPAPREQKVLDAARSLYGASGVARPSEIARTMGLEPLSVSQAITTLRAKSLWPYRSPMGRPPGDSQPKSKVKPNLSCLDSPAQQTAPKPTTPKPTTPTTSTASTDLIFDVLRAFDSLPPESRASLVAYLSTRVS